MYNLRLAVLAARIIEASAVPRIYSGAIQTRAEQNKDE
jgi:hypothetical protein